MRPASPCFAIIGAGGLGCPALLGLCDAGRGPIQVWDPDHVEASNLHRQVLYDIGDVGRPKVEAAVERLRSRARELAITGHHAAVESHAIKPFLAALPADAIVLECSDRPALKFALNDAAVAAGVPVVIGAALDHRTQAMVVQAGSACYRCIYETPPPAPRSCSEAGVLGPAVGLGGFLMAHLAVALASGRTDVAGRLFAIDVWSGRPAVLHPSRRPDCPACAQARTPSHGHPCATEPY